MASRKLKSSEPEAIPQNNIPGGSTSWKNGVPEVGWYRYPDNWWRDLPRLQRGLYQRMLIEYVWGATVPRQQGKAIPEKSPWLSYVEMATVFRCSPEQVRDDARDAGKRGLVVVEESRGKVRFQISWERWGNLKDYVAPRPVAVAKKPAPAVRWLSRAVTVEPGATFDLPKLDFAVERISLRNTSADGILKIGAGSCDGGILVLEAESSAKKGSIKSGSSDIERECTPPQSAGRVSGGRGQALADSEGAGNNVSRTRSERHERVPAADQVSSAYGDAVKILRSHGEVSDVSVRSWFSKQSITAEQFLDGARHVVPNPSADNPVGSVLSGILRYLAGNYKPAKKRSERDQRALDSMRLGRGEKIA